jgi:hypothetical protein
VRLSGTALASVTDRRNEEQSMAGSTLDPDNFPADVSQSKVQKGHDTRSLGPSDSSDSGSDMAGPGQVDDFVNFDRATNHDEAGTEDDLFKTSET